MVFCNRFLKRCKGTLFFSHTQGFFEKLFKNNNRELDGCFFWVKYSDGMLRNRKKNCTFAA
jgi:hypothetical protein